QLSAAELAARFTEAWVHAVPSVWAEPFGMTATEAMMRGTAAVVSATGGLRDTVLDGQTGFQVAPGDAEALAAALGRLLADRGLAAELGTAARVRALDCFTVETCRDRLLGHYRDVLA
ncbi:MAG TPA: glycosyltransferase, partial [Solirubrobacteraceae bacterium]|nr:glycosyltransferase [Solirubrobacteraceae bacterium]